MISSIRLVRVLVCVFAIGWSAATVLQAAEKKAAPPRSTTELGSDLDDLEALLKSLEKNIGTYDDRQRRSVYARLLALAEKIGVDLARQRALLKTAMASQPKNDPTGGLTRTVNEAQQKRQAELNKLDERLRALRARIAALNPDKKDGGAARGGGAGGGGGATVTPSAGDRKK